MQNTNTKDLDIYKRLKDNEVLRKFLKEVKKKNEVPPAEMAKRLAEQREQFDDQMEKQRPFGI